VRPRAPTHGARGPAPAPRVRRREVRGPARSRPTGLGAPAGLPDARPGPPEGTASTPAAATTAAGPAAGATAFSIETGLADPRPGQSSSATISLRARVPAELAAVGGLRSTLADALRREGWAGEAAFRVLIASTEAMVNALEHGSAPGGSVDVAFRVSARAVSVRVLDEGRPGRHASLAEPDAPPVTSRHGRGRLLMRAMADELHVRRHGRGTEVLLGFTPA
jgi:anti-sigma regulatory factor (Ser/Thr protein kinase)